MSQYSNLNGKMETRDHSINGANPKSQTSRENFAKKIKQKGNVLLITVLLFFIVSCASQLAIVKTEPKKNEITVILDMKQFLQENKNPAVVLRVPYSTSSVSEAEQKRLAQHANLYNRIERELLKAGFTVRDRGLLNNLLSTGQSSYAEIGKRIETDIIIEILSIDFAVDNYVHTATLKNSNKEIFATTNPKIAKLECKLTMVDKGLSGGILTLYYTSCTDGCEFVVQKQTGMWSSNNSYSQKYWSPDANQITLESVITYFSDIIANILRGNDVLY